MIDYKEFTDIEIEKGDRISLNDHVLVCGDSCDRGIVDLCLGCVRPILMVTDPPYGVKYNPSWREVRGGNLRKQIPENDSSTEQFESLRNFTGDVAYVWHAAVHSGFLQDILEGMDFVIKYQIIWNKNGVILSRGNYHWKHEPCFYAVRKRCKHNWQGSRKEVTVWDIANINRCSKSRKDCDEVRTEHSTQKPIKCMEKPILNNSAVGERVYDPFLGSGTTLIACERTGRICHGIEISPEFCKMAISRWVEHMKRNSKVIEMQVLRRG